jgi:hypothetical protein
MSTRINIAIDSVHSQVGLENRVDQGDKYNVVAGVINLLRALESGSNEGSMNVTIGDGDGEFATGEATVASSGAQSLTINGKALTGGTDYDIANLSVTEIAENIVAVVNASTDSRLQVVKASNVAGVVTIDARQPGVIGNLYTLAATGAVSVSGANLASGSDATQFIFVY